MKEAKVSVMDFSSSRLAKVINGQVGIDTLK
jgi:hypothetical protein